MAIEPMEKDVVLSQKQDFATTAAREPEIGKVVAQNSTSETDLRAWYSGLHAEAENRKVQCNVKQKEVIGKVMERIIEQQGSGQNKRRRQGEPLLWLLHGGPGTGKSHVIRLLKEELFEKHLGWSHGVDFQIAAYQAVNAENVNGDTLHHALGMSAFGGKGKARKSGGTAEEKTVATAKRIAQ